MFIKQEAFVMLEVMIAMTIMAILLCFAVPGLHAINTKAHDDLLRTELFAAIERARNEALVLQVPIVICKSSNHRSCGGNWADGYLTFINADKQDVLQRKEQLLTVIQTNAHSATIHWRGFPLSHDYLLFLPRGLLWSENGTFWLCHANDKLPAWAIIVNKSGRTRVVYPDVHGEIKGSDGKVLKC